MRRRRPSDDAVNAGLLALIVVLAIHTALVLLVPAVAPAIVNERLELALITAWGLVAAAVTALDLARARVTGDPEALVRASAFIVLTALNVVALSVLLMGLDDRVGGSLENPGQLPIVAALIARGVAAILLVAAALAALRAPPMPRRPLLVLVVPALGVLAVIGIASAFQDQLPELASPEAFRALARDPGAGLPPGSAPSLVIVQSMIAAALLAASWLAHRAYERTGKLATAMLSAALIVAAFSHVHGAIHPGGYAGVVATGDLLRIGFYALLLWAIVLERQNDLADLRLANVELRRLGDAELAAATLEERARLAREIHDGLAQDLWYAKLKQTRLAQLASLDGEARELSEEVSGAIDAALGEARNAVAAMRDGSEVGPIVEMIERQVTDFADRFALRAEFSTDGGPLPELGPRAKAEILRIVQEALTNVRKHADATVVRVRLERDGGLRLSVIDNGKGFDRHVVARGFGLDSMRQRAAAIDATLTVRSEPHNGTEIELLVPIEGA